nr:PREDICTED: uncharacterized protein LOC102349060 [Latimeria chalumnae]|eukprot:XP_006009301.2 PREDICTED: uncharacterized protein LOC102349060 [Latimeria chalumnae]
MSQCKDMWVSYPYEYKEVRAHKSNRRESAVVEEDKDWETDPDLINYGTERDLRWGPGSQASTDVSTASITSDLSKSIRSSEGFHRRCRDSASTSEDQRGCSASPCHSHHTLQGVGKKRPHSRTEATLELPATQNVLKQTDCFHCEKDENVQPEDHAFYYSEYKEFDSLGRQVVINKSSSTDSVSIYTYSTAHTSTSNHNSTNEKTYHINDLQEYDLEDSREYHGVVTQSNKRLHPPEKERYPHHSQDRFAMDYQDAGPTGSGLDRTSTFECNAAEILDEFFRQKIENGNRHQYSTKEQEDASDIYENVDIFPEKHKQPTPRQKKMVVSNRHKQLPVAEASLQHPAHSPSLDRIRKVLDKTQHLQNMQSHFESQIQKSKKERQLELEKEKEKAKSLQKASKQRGGAKGQVRSSQTRNKEGEDRAVTNLKNSHPPNRYCNCDNCKRTLYVPLEYTYDETKKGCKAIKSYSSQMLDQHSKMTKGNNFKTRNSNGEKLAEYMHDHIKTCTACHSTSDFIGNSFTKTSKDQRTLEDSTRRARGPPRKERSSEQMKRRSKEKQLAVQRWIDESPSKDFEEATAAKLANLELHSATPSCNLNRNEYEWDCSCDTCRNLDKKQGRVRAEPRKSLYSYKEGPEHTFYSSYFRDTCPKAEPVPKRNVQCQSPTKTPSCSDIELLEIPAGECQCSFCTRQQQHPKSEHTERKKAEKPAHVRQKPSMEVCTSLERLTEKTKGRDWVREIALSFERRARKEAEMVEREKAYQRLKEKELERKQRCPERERERRGRSSGQQQKQGSKHRSRTDLTKDSHHRIRSEGREDERHRTHRSSRKHRIKNK